MRDPLAVPDGELLTHFPRAAVCASRTRRLPSRLLDLRIDRERPAGAVVPVEPSHAHSAGCARRACRCHTPAGHPAQRDTRVFVRIAAETGQSEGRFPGPPRRLRSHAAARLLLFARSASPRRCPSLCQPGSACLCTAARSSSRVALLRVVHSERVARAATGTPASSRRRRRCLSRISALSVTWTRASALPGFPASGRHSAARSTPKRDEMRQDRRAEKSCPIARWPRAATGASCSASRTARWVAARSRTLPRSGRRRRTAVSHARGMATVSIRERKCRGVEVLEGRAGQQ